jgi:putative molybdopterin biosynthesis protein
METSKEDGFLTLKETTEFLRVSRSTVYRLLERGELPGYKISKRWKFGQKDLREFVAARRVSPGR